MQTYRPYLFDSSSQKQRRYLRRWPIKLLRTICVIITPTGKLFSSLRVLSLVSLVVLAELLVVVTLMVVTLMVVKTNTTTEQSIPVSITFFSMDKLSIISKCHVCICTNTLDLYIEFKTLSCTIFLKCDLIPLEMDIADGIRGSYRCFLQFYSLAFP